MTGTITIDWKSIAALGGSVVAVIFALKMDATAAEQVSIHAIDACKEAKLSCKR